MLSSALYFKRLVLACGLALALVTGIWLALARIPITQAQSLATTLVVTNTNNSGGGSLRQAILNANASPGADTIVFSLTGCPCVITLTTGLHTITEAVTISGPGMDQLAVNGNNSVRVFDIGAVPVTLSDLTVWRGSVSGHGAGIQSTGALTLVNVAVLANTSSNDGGGVYVDNTVVITGGLLRNNQCTNVGCNGGGLFAANALTLTNTQFISNVSSTQAGGAYAGGGVVMSGSRFERNRCAYTTCAGGGLYTTGDLTLIGGQFDQNQCTGTNCTGAGAYVGGSATVINGWFDRNECTGTTCNGAGLYTDGALILDGGLFDQNQCTATGCYGAGVYANGGAALSNGWFVGNLTSATTGAGGGLYTPGTLTLTDTLFVSNTADGSGGGAYALDNTAITGSRFERNQGVDGSGGGLYVSGTLTLSGTTFISNTARREGGGLYITGTLTSNGGLFQNNRCSFPGCDGGGVYAFDRLTLTGTQFISNTADGSGGGAHTDDAAALNGATFERNQSGDTGGGLYVFRTLTLTRSDFISNTADSSGGGAFVYGITQVDDGRFENNRSVNGAGGGLFTGSRLTLTNTDFISNSTALDGGGARAALTTHVNGGRFERNECSATLCSGGGLSVNADLQVIGTTFISNTAHYDGGGAFAYGPVQVDGASFDHNQAPYYGGGLYANDTLSVNDTDFVGNHAINDGGGVFVQEALTVTHSLFVNNIANSRGGGLSAQRGLAMNVTAFIENAAAQGGGLYLGYDGYGSVVNSLFARNAAPAGMALFLDSTHSTTIAHDTIVGLGQVGSAAIRTTTGTVGITDTIIARHTVGISNTGGTITEDYNLFFNNGLDTWSVITGTHSLIGDPRFVNPAANNFHLNAGSAAIDAGTNVNVPIDFEGDMRPQGGGVDIGFDEYLPRLYLPLVLR
jgi:predicted outer membrane repeat protein